MIVDMVLLQRWRRVRTRTSDWCCWREFEVSALLFPENERCPWQTKRNCIHCLSPHPVNVTYYHVVHRICCIVSCRNNCQKACHNIPWDDLHRRVIYRTSVVLQVVISVHKQRKQKFLSCCHRRNGWKISSNTCHRSYLLQWRLLSHHKWPGR